MKGVNQKFCLSDGWNIGAAIRKLREEQGLKAYELANKVGVNPVYITQIEKHNKLPSLFVMKQISDSLNNPGLLEVYIKIKCSSFCGVIGKIKDVSVCEIQEIEGAPIRKGLVTGIRKEYLLNVKVG